MHRVGVSGNVIWVKSQGPCGEHVHQLKMFAMPQFDHDYHTQGTQKTVVLFLETRITRGNRHHFIY